MPAELNIINSRGLDFAIWRWGGSGNKVLLVHATGFHSRCWDQVANHLPEFDCWAIDLRGHGLSSKPPPPYPWPEFGQDIASIVKTLNLTFAVAVGHSLGGHALCYAAAQNWQAYQNLLLLDPIIAGPTHYGRRHDTPHPVEKRRAKWSTAGEMFQSYHQRKPFNTWNEAVLKDYCHYGLLANAGAKALELACPPAIEGSIYNNSLAPEANILSDLWQIESNVLIMQPPRDHSRPVENLLPDNLHEYFPYATTVTVPHLTHFIPMEAPELVAEQIKLLASPKKNHWT